MKVYSVAHIDVVDQELYKAYTQQAPALVAAYGGRYIVRNGPKHALEGPLPTVRVVIMEFPSLERAKAWYASEQYQALAKIRQAASGGSSLYFIEAFDPLA